MKLNIKNLGPITNATIDLNKRFYTFVGYNNSGKSYMAQLLWALWSRGALGQYLRSAKAQVLFELYRKEFRFLESESVGVTYSFALSADLIHTTFAYFSSYIKEDYVYSLFGVNPKHPSLYKFEINFSELDFENITRTPIHAQVMGENSQGVFIIQTSKEPNAKQVSLNVKGENTISHSPYFTPPDGQLKLSSFVDMQEIYREIADVIISTCIQMSNAHYLPATRVYHPVFFPYIYKFEQSRRESFFKRVTLGEFADPLEALKNYKSSYTAAISDFTDKLLTLKDTQQNQRYRYITEKLTSLYGGNVHLKQSESLSSPDFQYQIGNQPNSVMLDMYMASSMVNQLTGLDLYFKYWTNNNSNTLIIDEPEVNLHANKQLTLLDILIEFATRDNNRVLITTHSPIMAKSINNHINLGKFKHKPEILHKLMDEIGLHREDPDSILSNEDFGVYFFSGTEVVEYEDSAYGVHFKDFDAEQYKVDKANELITDYLYYAEESEDV